MEKQLRLESTKLPIEMHTWVEEEDEDVHCNISSELHAAFGQSFSDLHKDNCDL